MLGQPFRTIKTATSIVGGAPKSKERKFGKVPRPVKLLGVATVAAAVYPIGLGIFDGYRENILDVDRAWSITQTGEGRVTEILFDGFPDTTLATFGTEVDEHITTLTQQTSVDAFGTELFQLPPQTTRVTFEGQLDTDLMLDSDQISARFDPGKIHDTEDSTIYLDVALSALSADTTIEDAHRNFQVEENAWHLPENLAGAIKGALPDTTLPVIDGLAKADNDFAQFVKALAAGGVRKDVARECTKAFTEREGVPEAIESKIADLALAYVKDAYDEGKITIDPRVSAEELLNAPVVVSIDGGELAGKEIEHGNETKAITDAYFTVLDALDGNLQVTRYTSGFDCTLDLGDEAQEGASHE